MKDSVRGLADLQRERIFLTEGVKSLLCGVIHTSKVSVDTSFAFFSPKDYLVSKGKIRVDSEPKLLSIAEIMQLIAEANFELVPPFIVPALRLLLNKPQIESAMEGYIIFNSKLLIVATVPIVNGDGEQFLFAYYDSSNFFRSIIEISGDPKTTYYSDKTFIVIAHPT